MCALNIVFKELNIVGAGIEVTVNSRKRKSSGYLEQKLNLHQMAFDSAKHQS